MIIQIITWGGLFIGMPALNFFALTVGFSVTGRKRGRGQRVGTAV